MPLSMPHTFLTLACLAAIPSNAAAQDTVLSGNHSIDGSACVGLCCTSSENYGVNAFKIKTTLPGLLFEDTGPSEFPDRDWQLMINDTFSTATGGEDYFGLKDVTGGTVPFRVDAGASTNALRVAASGRIGIGTSLPQRNLHIVGGSSAAVRLGASSTPSGPVFFDLTVDELGIYVSSGEGGAVPLDIAKDATGGALFLAATGAHINYDVQDYDFEVSSDDGTSLIFTDASTNKVGLGTNTPEGTLHVKGDGVQLSYLESGDGGAVQLRFRTDSVNRRFLAVNNANEVKSQIIFGDNEIKFTGATDSGANLWLSIGPSGIVSQGPTCKPGPCDATFDPDAFTIPSIEDHAAFMWENQHLWAVGPTKPGQPINLTQKMGGVVHELEVAHIYIEELHDQLLGQQAMLDLQRTELDAIKAMLAEQ